MKINDREFRHSLLTVVLPIAGQSLMTSLVSASDALMLGMLSQNDLSAVSLASQIQFVLTLFQTAFMIGASVLAAQYWGIRDRKTVEKVLGLSLQISLPVSAGFTLAALFIPQVLMGAFTSDPLLIQSGVSYLRAVSLSYLFMGFSQMYLNIMKNSGRVGKSAAFNSAAVVSNIVLNAVLIFGLLGVPALGIVGAAIATVLARGIELLLCIVEDGKQRRNMVEVACGMTGGADFCRTSEISVSHGAGEESPAADVVCAADGKYVPSGTEGKSVSYSKRESADYSDDREIREDKTDGSVCFRVRYLFHTDPALAREYRKRTAPVLANEIAWGLGSTMFSVIMGHLGSDAVAANSITNIIRNIAMSFCIGLGTGGGIIVGNLLGAGRLEEAKATSARLVRDSILFGAIAGGAVAALTPVFLHFSGTLTETARDYLKWMLLISAYYLIGRSLNGALVEGSFCAGGDTKFGFLCDLVNMWCIIIPLASLAAFVWKLPVMAVYFILNLDEIDKIPVEITHYRKYQWVRNLTGREGAEEQQTAKRSAQ